MNCASAGNSRSRGGEGLEAEARVSREKRGQCDGSAAGEGEAGSRGRAARGSARLGKAADGACGQGERQTELLAGTGALRHALQRRRVTPRSRG
ncbi:unnamed protein product [Rangifer tarandus platyrhynchus]|uniref:Uncharacterized protein n=2 Tax=Rangifer tarandus platyrhynchus TaxID=3082113 RepID=A0ACB0ED33_RANTA|nr:unnamed protein product [Rangifer tarandus platyrhynchus]CAI9698289.1 unnamed protein product [Rangifer tarandus platyrhynchus]